MQKKTNLKAISEAEMISFMEKLGHKPYRARQILHWIYGNAALSFDDMINLPMSLRAALNEKAYLSNLQLMKSAHSKDGSQKFLFACEDGELIESVLIPEVDRLTLCVSSQVGCAMGCAFCNTGLLGLKRNLMAYEITDQILRVIYMITKENMERPAQKPKKITNIVFMGMGEPLTNTREVITALKTITRRIGISKRRITLSTAGWIPGIRLLARKGPDVNLAISLNAATDRVRSRIMPINQRYPLMDLLDLCRQYPLPPRRNITFEYVLLQGINDSVRYASLLPRLLRGIRCKINLIPFNQVAGTRGGSESFRRPSDERILRFQNVLSDGGIATIIRSSKGSDISAACGQLVANHIVSRKY